MSAQQRLPRGTIKEAQRLARLCESHAAHALAERDGKNRAGAWLVHDSLAREYAAKAFDLATASIGGAA